MESMCRLKPSYSSCFQRGCLQHLRFVFYWRCLYITNMDHQINEDILDKEIRLIDSDGSQLGIMSPKEAQAIAFGKNLDLVKIAPGSVPPVCKVMGLREVPF